MAQPPRTPPRFVPTLTEVVQGAAVPPASPVPAHGAGVPASLARPPASAAPVSLAPAPVAAFAVPPKAPATPVAPAAPVALQLPEGFEEHLVHRVMQRVDVELDLRLREAIATVVQEQTRSMVPRLREEVESVVRHAVYEAVAQELEAPR